MKNLTKIIVFLISSFHFLFVSGNVLLLERFPDTRLFEYRDFDENEQYESILNDLKREQRFALKQDFSSQRYSDGAYNDRIDPDKFRQHFEDLQRIDYIEPHRERILNDRPIDELNQDRIAERIEMFDKKETKLTDDRVDRDILYESRREDEMRFDREKSNIFRDERQERQERFNRCDGYERMERIQSDNREKMTDYQERRVRNDLSDREDSEQRRWDVERMNENRERFTQWRLDLIKTKNSMVDIFSNSFPIILGFLVSYKVLRY